MDFIFSSSGNNSCKMLVCIFHPFNPTIFYTHVVTLQKVANAEPFFLCDDAMSIPYFSMCSALYEYAHFTLNDTKVSSRYNLIFETRVLFWVRTDLKFWSARNNAYNNSNHTTNFPLIENLTLYIPSWNIWVWNIWARFFCSVCIHHMKWSAVSQHIINVRLF